MRVFVEIQKFDQWWLRIALISVIALTALPFALSSELQQTEAPILWPMVLIVLVLTVGMSLLILFGIKLHTKIDDIGVHFYFFPFNWNPRTIAWGEIAKIYTREYSPISEYGGWGYRGGIFKKNNIAFNVKGKIGIQLELTNGKKILIGTQKQSGANTVIKYYTNKSDNYDTL